MRPRQLRALLALALPGAASAWRYHCKLCACDFDKLKNYDSHMVGKRHLHNVAAEQGVWDDWQASGWWFRGSVSREEVTREFSLDQFVDGLPGRSRSSTGRVLGSGVNDGQLDPGLMLGSLPDGKRAALWRYCRDLGRRCGRGPAPAAHAWPAMLAELEPRYCRVKELLESGET